MAVQGSHDFSTCFHMLTSCGPCTSLLCEYHMTLAWYHDCTCYNNQIVDVHVQPALYCTVLYGTVPYHHVPSCIALYCTICIVLYCVVLYCMVLYYPSWLFKFDDTVVQDHQVYMQGRTRSCLHHPSRRPSWGPLPAPAWQADHPCCSSTRPLL